MPSIRRPQDVQQVEGSEIGLVDGTEVAVTGSVSLLGEDGEAAGYAGGIAVNGAALDRLETLGDQLVTLATKILLHLDNMNDTSFED